MTNKAITSLKTNEGTSYILECEASYANLTCVGISPSVGKRTQFRHILVTISSRITTISCVQYWMRHGLDVKTALGTLRRKSSVMELGMAGLEMGQTGKFENNSQNPAHRRYAAIIIHLLSLPQLEASVAYHLIPISMRYIKQYLA